tara:strand:+ start:119 stop:589 length:471 start_codon:yes stop_codon:yes gene_type:complete
MISQEILKSIDVSEIINPILEKKYNIEKGRYTLFATGKKDILFPNKGNEFPWLLNNYTNNVLKANLWGNGSDYRHWCVKYKTGKHSHINCHSLIASAFLENDNPKLKKIVLHLNNKKYDYRLCNLKWGSYKENNRKFKDGSKVKKREQAIINENIL